MDLVTFRTAVERAWTATTTYCPEDWHDHDPAWGQCAVTSVLVAETFGGDLFRGTAELPSGETTSHYWNCVGGRAPRSDVATVPGRHLLRDVESATRATLIANRWMEARYTELESNVELRADGHRSARAGRQLKST